MSTHEFQVRITDREVFGLYGRTGTELENAGEGVLAFDPLALDTVKLMDEWLNYWDRIKGTQWEGIETALLKPSTLELMGTHLWKLILDNDVGARLIEEIPAAGQASLRLSIEFTDDAHSALRGLPWEFLFEPRNRWFLSTKTELLLTRYVTSETGRVKVSEIDQQEQLRVLIVGALPGGDEFVLHREKLGFLETALKDVPELDVLQHITEWDKQKITKALSDVDKPVHIVHVVGICKGPPGEPQMYLGAEGKRFQDPDPLVQSLTANGSPPRLVILQLCDFKGGDATENFERLAPALIKRKVPAVLALQYAAEIDQGDQVGLGKQFYEALANGEHIGAAVQASRHRLYDENTDRRFGTPVLYLQEDGALIRRAPTSAGSGSVKPETRSGGVRASAISDILIDVVVQAEIDDGERNGFLLWLAGVDFGGQLTGPQLGQDNAMRPGSRVERIEMAKTIVRDRQREHQNARAPWVYNKMLVALGRLAEEHGHGRR